AGLSVRPDAGLGLLHFQPKVVPFAGALADAGEDGEALIDLGDTGDEFGEDDRLAQPGPAEKAGFATADERGQQVDDLDAGLEDFGLRRERFKLWRLGMYGAPVLGRDRPAAVDDIAEQVEYAAQRLHSHWHLHRLAGVDGVGTAHEAVGRTQGDTAHAAAADVLLHLA